MYKFVCYIILTISLFSCKGKDNEIVNFKSRSANKISIRVSKINFSSFENLVISNGKVYSIFKSEINFNTSNKLDVIKVRNGQKAKRGQLLASLKNNLLKNNVEKAKIELQKAKNKLAEEKINYGQKNITSTILKNLEIKSGVSEAKNNLERAQIEYEQTLLRAPFSGIIANIEKKQGDYITTSDVFCTLINPDNLEVSFSVLENEFGFVSKEQEIEIQSFANKYQQFKGVITEINPIVDKNGLIKIKAKVTSKNTGLLDGMNVKVFINKPLKDVLVIPKKALVLRSNRKVVFTVENGLAKWNYVEVAGENNDSYAIKKGLKATDTIIVSGNLNLAHDAKVNATFVSDERSQN